MFLGALLSLNGQSRTKFSVHVDPQFAWFGSDDDSAEPSGSIFHVQYGLQMDRFFEEKYAFNLGFGINNLGGNLFYADSVSFASKGDTLYSTPGTTMKHNLQYIDMPIGLKLKTEELGYFTFFLQLGFNPMFNINASATSDDGTFDKENIRENIHLFNLGYHAGIGLEYQLGGSTSAIGGIRWTSGLTDVTNNDGAKITTKAISIHLGILF
jgi:hypothetical protein